MRGDTVAHQNGNVPQLIQHADQEGPLTVEEIVEILATEELPIEYQPTGIIGEMQIINRFLR